MYGFVGEFSDGRKVKATMTRDRVEAFEAIKAAVPEAHKVLKKSRTATDTLRSAVEKAYEKKVAPIVFINKARFALYYYKKD